MSDTKAETPTAPVERVSLDEFCTRLSGRSRQIELIAAFAHLERAAGRHHDTEAAYESRFAAAGQRKTER